MRSRLRRTATSRAASWAHRRRALGQRVERLTGRHARQPREGGALRARDVRVDRDVLVVVDAGREVARIAALAGLAVGVALLVDGAPEVLGVQPRHRSRLAERAQPGLL